MRSLVMLVCAVTTLIVVSATVRTLTRIHSVITPSVELRSMAGDALNSFFDGLAPDASRVIAIHHRKKLLTCRPAEGRLAKLGRLLGFGSIAHAQGYCDAQTNCPTPCYYQPVSYPCRSGTCPSGSYQIGEPSGWAEQGYQQTGQFGCGEPGCMCATQSCFGCPS
jgi:hypothetical protein